MSVKNKGWSNVGHRIHGMGKTREYRCYTNARNRCLNPNNPSYANYGGRGIGFTFSSFSDFYRNIGPCPSAQHSIDRIDNNKGYEHGNVRWATSGDQQIDCRSNRLLTLDGVTLAASQWCRIFGIKHSTLSMRLDVRGWDTRRALTEPTRRKYAKNS